jgi:hypothetical protein
MITSESPELSARRFPLGVEADFAHGKTAQLLILARAHEQLSFGLKVQIPPDAVKNEILHLDLVQRNAKGRQILGGIAVRIRVL